MDAQAASNPAVVAMGGGSQLVLVFARTDSQTIRVSYYRTGWGWAPGQNLSNGTSFISDPVAVTYDDNTKVIVAAQVVAGNYVHRKFSESGGWDSSWLAFPGALLGKPALAVIRSALHDVVVMVGRGLDHAYWSMRYSSSGGWDATWHSLGGNFGGPPVVAGYATDRVLVAGIPRDGNGVAIMRRHSLAGGWDPSWISLGTKMFSAALSVFNGGGTNSPDLLMLGRSTVDFKAVVRAHNSTAGLGADWKDADAVAVNPGGSAW